MILKVGTRTIDKFNDFNVTLKYDSIASTFSGAIYFDPYNNEDRKMFVPGKYNICQISHNGETLLTGVLLSNSFKSSSVKNIMRIGGYSKTGVLEDCQKPNDLDSQFDTMSLKQIADKLLGSFGLSVTVDPIVSTEVNRVYTTPQVMEVDDTIKDYLTKLAAQINVVLSHDTSGNLIFTRADTNKTPIFNFNGREPATEMSLIFDGQQMHSKITAIGQQSVTTDNAPQNEITNPYVQQGGLDWMATAKLNTLGLAGVKYSTGLRPRVSKQTSGGDNQTTLTARQLLGQELKAIKLIIKVRGWTLGNAIIRPNNIVTVINPELFLYQRTKWFIEQVDFGFEKESFAEVATITCVLPECYNNDEVKNIFTGTNITVPVATPEGYDGAHAVITPFVQNDSNL